MICLVIASMVANGQLIDEHFLLEFPAADDIQAGMLAPVERTELLT
jgi:hypothetical protein